MANRKDDGEHVHPWVMCRLPRDLVERARAAWPKLVKESPDLAAIRQSDAAAVRVLLERALRDLRRRR